MTDDELPPGYPVRPGITETELLAGYRVTLPPASAPAMAPTRVAVYVPHRGAITPWIVWLAGRGWHIHQVGLAAYVHPPRGRGLGWIVGFAVTGEPVPSWWSLLRPYAGGRGRHRYAGRVSAPLAVAHGR